MVYKRPAYSKLMKEIEAKRFVLTGELEPEKTTGLEEILVSARAMKPYVVAANVTDNPLAMAFMNSLRTLYSLGRLHLPGEWARRKGELS